MSTVPLEIVTPDRLVYAQEANFIVVKGGYGELGILPRHTPLATTVKPCVVKVRTPEGEVFIPVSGGFLEVLPERVTILADTAELPEDIDMDRARKAKERAEQRLAARTDENIERTEMALQRANLRLEALELSGRTNRRA